MLALMCFGMWGCSSASTPSGTVSAALDALKAQDASTLSKYYGGDTSAMSDPEGALKSAGEGSGAAAGMLSTLNGGNTELTDEQKAMMQTVAAKLLDFDYKVSNEKVEGDKATVDVEITTYDFGNAVSQVFSEYMSNVIAAAFSQDSESSNSQDMLLDIAVEKTQALTSKDKVGTTTLSLTKGQDGAWKVDDLRENREFIDAISGGVLTKVTEIAESFANAFSGIDTADGTATGSEEAGSSAASAEAAQGESASSESAKAA
jgi:hypothetical protein